MTRSCNSEGNIRYKRIKHTWKNGKCVYCGASQSEYERGEELETHAYEFIHTDDLEKLFNMKFDVIISNPPYQLSDGDGGNGTSAIPQYQKYVEKALKLQPKYLTMIIPARWYAGGRNLDEFREQMLNDSRIRIIGDYFKSEDCFPGVDISGDVCYFLWDRDVTGDYTVVSHVGKETTTMIRPLLEKNADSFIRFNQSISILRKIQSFNEQSFETIVSTRRPFALNADDYIHSEKDDINLVNVYAYPKNGYVSKNCIRQNDVWVKQYKVRCLTSISE